MLTGALSGLCNLEGPFRWLPVIGVASGIACLVLHVLDALDHL